MLLSTSTTKRVDRCVTVVLTVAAGDEVQHWIWLLRTFSDRCCVTHLNARLLYMVSLVIHKMCGHLLSCSGNAVLLQRDEFCFIKHGTCV